MFRTCLASLLFFLCAANIGNADERPRSQLRTKAQLRKRLIEQVYRQRQNLRRLAQDSEFQGPAIKRQRAEIAKLRTQLKRLEGEIAALRSEIGLSFQEGQLKLLRSQLRSTVVALRQSIDATGKKGPRTAQDRAELRMLTRGYMTLASSIAHGKVNGDNASKLRQLRPLETAASIRRARAIREAQSYLQEQTRKSGRLLDRHKYECEGKLRAVRLDEEALYVVKTALTPGVELDNNNPTKLRLRELEKRLTSQDPNRAPAAPGVDRDVTRWLLTLQQELDLEEFRRFAAYGLIKDGDRVVSGKVRKEIAYYSELGLAESARRASWKLPISTLFWGEDSRMNIAAHLQAEAEDHPDYQVFNYLEAGLDPPVKQYFRAVARVVRNEQLMIDEWWNQEYDRGFWKTGLGTLLRVSNFPGTQEASRAQVQARIGKFLSDCDFVHDCFMAAADADKPDELNRQQQALLEKYGYIQMGYASAEKEFGMPTREGSVGALIRDGRQGLRLPGESWLNVINPKNIAVTIAAVAIPGMAAAKVEQLALEATSLSWRSVTALRVMADAGAGLVIDALDQQWEEGSVDVKSLFIESVLVGGVLNGVSSRVEKLSQAAMARIAEYKASSLLRKVMTDRQMRRKATGFIANTLGMASESALTSLYQSEISGHDVDYTTFLSNMLNNAMAQTMSRRFEGPHSDADRELREQAPEWLKEHLADDPALRREIIHHGRNHQQAKQQLRGAQEALVRDGESGKISGDRAMVGLLKGDWDLNQLRNAFISSPEAFGAIMDHIVELREGFIADDTRKIREVGESMLRIAKDHDEAEIKKHFGDSQEALTKIAEAQERFEWELKQLNKKIIAPGSSSRVSDKDTSSNHPFIIRMFHQLHQDRDFRGLEGDAHRPSSSRSLDANFYYNFIEYAEHILPHKPGSLDGLKGDAGMTHGETLTALSIAATMQHMWPLQKLDYKAQRIHMLKARMLTAGTKENGKEWRRAVEKLKKQFSYAEASLVRSRKDLNAKLKASGLDANNPDHVLKAKFEVYFDRTLKFHEGVFHYERESDPDVKRQKLAQLERDMRFLLRDGIETYTSTGSLEIIVNQIQIKGGARKIEHFLKDPTFVMGHKKADGSEVSPHDNLKHLSADEVQAILDDQVMMMVDHLNHFRTGHERPFHTGKAFAKYGQRCLLALKIRGDIDIQALLADPNSSHPAKRLLNVTSELLKFKDQPKKFKEQLKSLSTKHPKSEIDGVEQLVALVGETVPLMANVVARRNQHEQLTAWRPRHGSPFVKSVFSRSRIYHISQEDRQLDQIRELGGGAAEEMAVRDLVRRDQDELADVRAQIALMERLAAFRGIDWQKVLRLEERLRGLNLITRSVQPTPNQHQGYKTHVIENYRNIKKRIKELRGHGSGKTGLKHNQDYLLLCRQEHHLVARLGELRRLESDARRLAAEQAAFENLNLTGNWKCGPSPDYPGRARIIQSGKELRVWLTWKHDSQPAPHYYAEARLFRGGKIRGSWEAFHSTPLAAEKRKPMAGPARGLWYAQATADGLSIVSTDETDANIFDRRGLKFDWTDQAFLRDDTAAPTTFQPLSAASRNLKQSPVAEPDVPNARQEGNGHIHVKCRTGRAASVAPVVSIYAGNTFSKPDEDLVVRNKTGFVEIEPGEYDVVYEGGWNGPWNVRDCLVRRVRVSADQIAKAEFPSFGRIRLSLRRADGREFIDSQPRLLIFKGNRQTAQINCHQGHDVPPGEYRVVYRRHGDRQVDAKLKVNVAAGKEVVVTVRFGNLIVEVFDVKGNNVTSRIGDGLCREYGKPVRMFPGNYEMNVHFKHLISSVSLGQTTVHPTNVTHEKVRLGRLNLFVDGRRARQKTLLGGSGYSLHFKRLNPQATFLTRPFTGMIDLPPGVYQVRVIRPERTQKRSFTIRPGRTTTIKVDKKDDK